MTRAGHRIGKRTRRALYTAAFQRPNGTTLYVADGKPVFSGMVYHASYLRFMERGRTNYLRLLGADQRALFEETEKEAPGFAFVVRSMQIEFRKAARMDDVLEVTTMTHEVRGASITLDQRVMRGEEVLIEARVQVAFVSGGRARRIPEALRTAMRANQRPSP